MNKAQLVAEVATKAKISKACAELALDAAVGAIVRALRKGEGFKVPGFGALVVKKRAARRGTNPATGAKITIPASKTVCFKVSKALKTKL